MEIRVNRREFIGGATALGGWAVLSRSLRAESTGKFTAYPFTLGVASGQPGSRSVALWTRLAPDPLRGGMEPVPVEVKWQVAADEGMKNILQQGKITAHPRSAHAVHVEVDALEPDRFYWYQFIAGDAESPVGRTRTLPAAGAQVGALRFAAVSCQHWETGLYTAYRHLVADDAAFIVHLGDYIYDVARGGIRRHEREEPPRTLDEFRARHALYKTDPDLQAAHAAVPFFVIPDNHDALHDNEEPGDSLARRAAAYQAWYEHMPLRSNMRPSGAAMPIRQGIDIGNLVRLNLLDTRQFREHEDACPADPGYGFGIYRPVCAAVMDENRTMLGAAQERWLARRMKTSQAVWNAFASTVLFAPFRLERGGVEHIYKGGWDAYPANRARIVRDMQTTGLSNPVVLSGDLHSSWAVDVPAEPASREIVAGEFLCTSISSSWPAPLNDPIEANLARNPHVCYYDGRRRGYALFSLAPDRWETRMRTLETVQRPDAPVKTAASFVIEAGRPGIRET